MSKWLKLILHFYYGKWTHSDPIQVTAKNTLKKIERFLARKGVLSGGVLDLNTLCRGSLAIQHLLGCCILGETSQRWSVLIIKFNQPRA